MSDKSTKLHYTKRPEYLIRRAFDIRGLTHAKLLSSIIGKHEAYCAEILSGNRDILPTEASKICAKLGLTRKELGL